MKETTILVITKRKLSDKFLLVSFRSESKFEYLTGQWVLLKIGSGRTRAYSIASILRGNDFEILVDVTPGGPGSRFFIDLNRGDRVVMRGPCGKFVINRGDKKRLWVATGSGIAPMRAMLQQLAVERDTKEGILLWGLRHAVDEVLAEEWRRLEKQMNRFDYRLCLTRSPVGWQGKKGRVTVRIKEMGDLSGWSVYICGRREMVEEVEQLVLAKGVKADKIYFEKFC